MNYIIKNREIFAVGIHNGNKYTIKDLEMLVANSKELDFQPAIKLGHKAESGAPAYGYLENMRIVGDKIVADMTHLAKETYQAIKDKRFARVSVEIYENLNRSGKVFKLAIGAIALLGQEIAGVAGLQTPNKFESSELENMTSYDFDMIENNATTNGDGNSDAGSGDNDGDDNMSKEELDLANKKIAKLSTQVQTLTDGAASNDDAAKEVTKKFENSQKELKKLQLKMLNNEAGDKAKLVTVPAMRGQFKALYEHALGNEDTKIKVFNLKSEKDEELTLTEVLDAMVAFINTKSKGIFMEFAGGHQERSEGYDDPSAELNTRIEKHMAKDGNSEVNYAQAMSAVLAADPELKSAYAQI